MDDFNARFINIVDADDASLMRLSKEGQLSLNLREMKIIQDYFKKIGRIPTDVELETIAQTWSEHCAHKTFKSKIVTEDGVIESLMKSYIFKVTEELNLPWCFSVFKDNAGIVEFENGYGVAVKVETHNHPSAVEPFGGAATSVGGVIRDVLGVWADPIANTDVLCFGPLNFDYEKLPSGIKHPRFIFNGVVSGIGAYGNNMGIPTVNGAVCFDESYVGNPLVYSGCVGILPLNKYLKKTKPDDVALLVGGKTGKDGLHGATFSSVELSEKSEEVSRPAVQIPNPIEEEKVKRAVIAVRDKELASNITDLGAGGISSATCEMANNFNCGIIIDLGKVSLREKHISPWEIFLSESQERMLLSVPKENLQKVLEIFQEEDVEATAIGEFIEEKKIIVNFNGNKVAELELNFLFDAPRPIKKAVFSKNNYTEPNFEQPDKLGEILSSLLSSPNIASKESVIRTYDHEVKGNTILKPLQGMYSSPNNAAIIKPLNNSNRGVVISSGIKPRYGKIDTYWMAASVIDEAIRNNISVGGKRIALLDNFCWGSPDKPDRLGDLVNAAKACYDFAKAFETPFISGKDSLYNESPLGSVVGTLLITAVGIIPDVRRAISSEFKKSGNPVYIVGNTYHELGGSEYYNLLGFIGNSIPKVNSVLAKKIFDKVTKAIDLGYIKACHDISEGGLAVAVAEMSIGSKYGVKMWLKDVPRENLERDDLVLFSESNSRFLVEVDAKYKNEFENLVKEVPCVEIGEVTEDNNFSVYGLNGQELFSLSVESLRETWKSGIK